MAEFLISYDLEGDQTRERYEALAGALRKIGARRVLWSQWVMTGRSAEAVFGAVAHLFQPSDRLLVSPFWDVWQYNLLA